MIGCWRSITLLGEVTPAACRYSPAVDIYALGLVMPGMLGAGLRSDVIGRFGRIKEEKTGFNKMILGVKSIIIDYCQL